MKFANPYISLSEKVSTLQRWIIFHSYLYYELDKPMVEDKIFDDNCKQLMDLLWDFEGETRYSKIFKNFDGNTGYDLWSKCSDEIKALIIRDVKIVERNQNGK